MINYSIIVLAATLAVTIVFSTSGGSMASDSDVVGVKVAESDESGGSFRFDVTLRHNDSGWEHYANVWEVVSPDGEVLATRVLAHPHVDEQPFTRSLSAVVIPTGISEVTIRAGDNVDGIGGKKMLVKLPGRK